MDRRMVDGGAPGNSSWAGGVLRHFEEWVSGAALVILILATCWGVISRYITSQAAAWTGEVAGMAFCWLIFVGAAAGFKYGMHVTIDALVVRLPAGARRGVLAAIDGLVLLFLALLLVLSVEFTFDSWGDPSSVLRLPRSVTYASVVVGSLCMLARYGRAAARRWRGQPGAWMHAGDGAGAEL